MFLSFCDKEKETDISDIEATLEHLQQEAMERDIEVSQRVHASTLEELNLADNITEQRKVLIAKEMQSDKKSELKELL